MDLLLSDKIVMVTGASSGIGAAAAVLFAQEGAHVVISYAHNRAGAEETAALVQSLGRRAWLLPVDLSAAHQIMDAFGQLGRQIAGLDGLVLCAGKNVVTPFDRVSAEEWQEVLAVNLNGPFVVLREARPLLREGSGVVTVASVAAQTGAPHHAHYAAAKAGLINLTKSAAREMAPKVRVNCVSPGLTLTPMGEETISSLDADYARKKLLLQRYADPLEIARVIVFLASPAASFMTGATVDVNGGRELR